MVMAYFTTMVFETSYPPTVYNSSCPIQTLITTSNHQLVKCVQLDTFGVHLHVTDIKFNYCSMSLIIDKSCFHQEFKEKV